MSLEGNTVLQSRSHAFSLDSKIKVMKIYVRVIYMYIVTSKATFILPFVCFIVFAEIVWS